MSEIEHQGQGGDAGQPPLPSLGQVCLQPGTSSKVLVARKSILVSLEKPRSMPCSLLCAIAVWVTSSPAGGLVPSRRIAALGVGAPLVTGHEPLPDALVPPAYSTRA